MIKYYFMLTQADYLSTAKLLNQLDMQLIKPNEIRNHRLYTRLLPLVILILTLDLHYLHALALTALNFISFILVSLEIYSQNFINRCLTYSIASYRLHQLYLNLSYC